VKATAPYADALITTHTDTAHAYELLHRAVTDGLLSELEARYG